MLNKISKSQILERIRLENPWWETGSIEDDFNQMSRREYFSLLRPLVYEQEVRRAIVLMGPRRVGKTVMLHHLIQDLIDSGVNPRKILFLTIENPIYQNTSLEDLFTLAKEAANLDSEEGWFVIFDEIQYLRQWEVHLKVLVDTFRKNKFIVSGSAAAALKYSSHESGAGRFTDFLLPPLTFHEYISLRKLDGIIKPIELLWNGKQTQFFTSDHLDKLNSYFLDYLNYGGYPEITLSEKLQSNPGRYIRQDIIDKVLLRDLPGLYGIKDSMELNALFTSIAYNTGREFSLESLSQYSQVPKNVLKKYFEYLEAAFLIKIVRRIDHAGKRFKRDNFFKIYLTNPSLRSALFSPVMAYDDFMGNLVETAIFSQWMHRDSFTPWYARWNDRKKTGEVDMVCLNSGTLKPKWALEIKWSNRYFEKPAELKSLHSFCSSTGLNHPIVTTIDKQGVAEHKGITYQFLPAASYAYTVGMNTLSKKKPL